MNANPDFSRFAHSFKCVDTNYRFLSLAFELRGVCRNLLAISVGHGLAVFLGNILAVDSVDADTNLLFSSYTFLRFNFNEFLAENCHGYIHTEVFRDSLALG